MTLLCICDMNQRFLTYPLDIASTLVDVLHCHIKALLPHFDDLLFIFDLQCDILKYFIVYSTNVPKMIILLFKLLASACAYQKAADSGIDILDGGNTDHNYNFLHPHLLFIYAYSSLKVFIDVERLYLLFYIFGH